MFNYGIVIVSEDEESIETTTQSDAWLLLNNFHLLIKKNIFFILEGYNVYSLCLN